MVVAETVHVRLRQHERIRFRLLSIGDRPLLFIFLHGRGESGHKSRDHSLTHFVVFVACRRFDFRVAEDFLLKIESGIFLKLSELDALLRDLRIIDLPIVSHSWSPVILHTEERHVWVDVVGDTLYFVVIMDLFAVTHTPRQRLTTRDGVLHVLAFSLIKPRSFCILQQKV